MPRLFTHLAWLTVLVFAVGCQQAADQGPADAPATEASGADADAQMVVTVSVEEEQVVISSYVFDEELYARQAAAREAQEAHDAAHEHGHAHSHDTDAEIATASAEAEDPDLDPVPMLAHVDELVGALEFHDGPHRGAHDLEFEAWPREGESGDRASRFIIKRLPSGISADDVVLYDGHIHGEIEGRADFYIDSAIIAESQGRPGPVGHF
ncbi:MAG: hypothetical protein AAF970_06630 [Bacteroidota bacterium]